MATRKTATLPARKPAARAQKSESKAPAIAEFDRDAELKAYREMLLIRRFEEKAGQLYGMGFIGGFCHLYIGQEAVVVGMQMALKDGDQMITGYRDHGHMLAMGMSARGVMACRRDASRRRACRGSPPRASRPRSAPRSGRRRRSTRSRRSADAAARSAPSASLGPADRS